MAKKKIVTFVGTYRNPCLSWIKEKRLYNIPVFYNVENALEQYKVCSNLWLIAEGGEELHFKLKNPKLVSIEDLRKLDYPCSKNPHSDMYVLFELSDMAFNPEAPTQYAFIIEDFAKNKTKAKLINDFLRAKVEKKKFAKESEVKKILPAPIVSAESKNLMVSSCSQMHFLNDLFSASSLTSKAQSPKTKFRLGELFCGPGGIACGALRAISSDGSLGIKHVWANDYDPDTCETYRRNICPEAPETVYCGDVRNLDISKLGKIDAFCYGFPCNSFSSVGEHKGLQNEKFGQLYWYGIEVLKKFKPKWFMAENVSGICSAGSGDFEIILNDMREAGYKLNVNLYRAEEYGIPQRRHRVIIVGIRNDLDVEYKVPSPRTFANCDVSSRTALADIPENAPNSNMRRLSHNVLRRLALIRPGENVWQAEERLGDAFPEELKIKTKTKISQIYRKLHPDKPAYTVTAAGGGGTFMYHWTDRELTNRERARIQTFPDDYAFMGDYSSVRKQIGMAVPCRLSEIVITAILNSFAGIKYPSVKANLKE